MYAKGTQKHRYRDLLGEKEYIKIFAFSWLVYTLTGSAALTAVTYGVNYLV